MPKLPQFSMRDIFVTVLGSLLLIGGVLAVYEYRRIILASLVGVGIGVLISPIVSFMQRKANVPRGITALLVIVLILGSFSAFGYLLYTLLAHQVSALIDQAPQIANKLSERIGRFIEQFPWVEQQINELNLSQTFKNTVGTLFKGVRTSLAALAGAFLVLMLAVYISVNSKSYLQGLLTLFANHHRPKAAEIAHGSALVLRRWFNSQLIVMSISGVVTTLALWIIGIEYWLLLGVLTAVFGFVPYIGAIITGAAAVLVTLGSEPDKVWWVLAVYVVIQQLEGDVTIPLVMKGRVELPEAHLLVFILIMGAGFGLLGVFVAPPLFAVLRYVYLNTYVPKMDES